MNKLRDEQIVIKENIYDGLGNIYIAKNTRINLNAVNISRFKRMGIWESIIENRKDNNYKNEKNIEEKIGPLIEVYRRKKGEYFGSAMACIQKVIFEDRIFKKYPHLGMLLEHAESCYTHSINVAVLSVLLAQSMHYDEQTIKEIAIGALLHDIGGIFMDREIIEKDEAELTIQEMEIKQRHCSLGVMAMNSVDIPYKSRKIIEQHHERLDGTGYPHQLKGIEILEEAHLVAVADALDIRTSYKYGTEISEIEAIIQEMYNLPEKYSRKYTEILKDIFEE